MIFKPQGHQKPDPGLSKTDFCSLSETNHIFFQIFCQNKNRFDVKLKIHFLSPLEKVFSSQGNLGKKRPEAFRKRARKRTDESTGKINLFDSIFDSCSEHFGVILRSKIDTFS